ncbi:MAG TPA: discoidin domain-containing protein, partial [Egibacteraceae bacterium]|nr:discoidin domain-containing protein [Egibacteraceae bacterium]
VSRPTPGGVPAAPRAAHAAPRAPQAPQPAAPGGRRRWTVPLVAAFLGVGVLLLGLATGVLDGSPAAPDGDGSGGGGLAAPAAVTLFDPGGSGSEDDADLPAMLDGDPSTGWRSVGYNTPDFGGLKPGLGFAIDLGAPHAVAGLALRTGTPGISYEVRVADGPRTDLDGWEPVGGASHATELTQVDLAAPVVTRYVLVWITGGLQPDGSGRYRAQVSELAVIGDPA